MKEFYKQMQELVKKHDIVVVTARQGPRHYPIRVTAPPHGMLIVDYISLVK